MAKRRVQVIKFDAVNKKQIRGKIGHTRTGACPARGRCYHGRTARVR